eukprot:m.223873 g.223873  ORF g.223873 m.223873 type:complete len:51 (+) comp15143_c0_seq1:2677-2829(+)
MMSVDVAAPQTMAASLYWPSVQFLKKDAYIFPSVAVPLLLFLQLLLLIEL